MIMKTHRMNNKIKMLMNKNWIISNKMMMNNTTYIGKSFKSLKENN